MPLTIRIIDDQVCPIVVCDVCQKQIAYGTDGNYEWDDDEDAPVVYFSHKACSARLRLRHDTLNMWGPLSALPAYLLRNLQVTWKESDDSADFMNSV